MYRSGKEGGCMNGAIGSVNGIVESFYTADAYQGRQNTDAKDNSFNSFQDYLNAALNNYRTGMLTGSSLYSNYGNYSNYDSVLSGVAVNALLSRILESQPADSRSEKSGSSQKAEKEKPAWASIRVIRRYQEPTVQPQEKKVDAIC